MTEVREISKAGARPDDVDHVLIEPTSSGKFTANGSATHPDNDSRKLADKGATFYSPPAFETLEAAIASAKEWADKHNVPTVYVIKPD